MEPKLIERGALRYLYYETGACQIAPGAELDLIGACFGEQVAALVMDSGALPDAFFSLRTGFAGALLQKMAQYNIRAALIAKDEPRIRGKFEEMLLESNRGPVFRSFDCLRDAEQWLQT